jgi:uncharacterized damage-inducible protein DinB
MNTAELFRKLAGFNAWANGKIYDSCAALPADALREDRGAFFGSIHATLNHLLAVDKGWISRIEGVESGVASLDQILFEDMADLRRAREAEDARLIRLCDSLSQDGIDRVVSYKFMNGTPAKTALDVILITLFNHQTHHRGQVHAMLTQAGRPSLDLDIIVYEFEREAA